jgi:YidC/Oxa1 family membrane protein insertase
MRGKSTPGTAAAETRTATPPPATAQQVGKTPREKSDTVTVRQGHSALSVLAVGASPVRAELTDYRNLSPAGQGSRVSLEAGNGLGLLNYHLNVNGADVALDSVAFTVQRDSSASGQMLTLRGTAGALKVSIAYLFTGDDSRRYIAHVTVGVAGAPSGTAVDVSLPRSLISAERDTLDDDRNLAVAFKAPQKDVENRPFGKIDTTREEVVAGPEAWAGVRNKYFLVAVMAPPAGIARLSLRGETRQKGGPATAIAATTFIMSHDTVGFDLYAGPQEYERLRSLGSDLDQVNPYAGWVHGVVQPFATIVTRVLLWMKSTTGLGYGWVIVIFGVVIRVMFWPLNQSAMRTSMRMQRLQPELAEVQARYKSDPEKQREALITLYAAHGMTPLSPMMGCLPMLLPMPIILALYFVFRTTIEFRGVSFLWLPDISAADPYYLTPLLMGASMFALSWIGMRGTPPTPQTRAMSYMMPVMLTFMFFRFAAGLNLYYAVQNVAALPQQWLLSRERLRTAAAVAPKKKIGTG